MAQADKPMAKQRNVVIGNEIFREKVRSEKRHAFLNENFDLNPKNLICVSDKPTKEFKVAEQKDEELTMKLSSLTTMPKQKF